jgi:hypothetical protein
VRRAIQAPGACPRERNGTVLALREDPARARLWERDVETVAMSPADTPSGEAARLLEVVLDLIGCLSTPPTGYLLDPAYRGMLDEEEQALAEALAHVEQAMPAETTGSAGAEVAALLRRLGSRGGEGTPPDAATDRRDDRVQEQRPG